jgi:hypothetical protein
MWSLEDDFRDTDEGMQQAYCSVIIWPPLPMEHKVGT